MEEVTCPECACVASDLTHLILIGRCTCSLAQARCSIQQEGVVIRKALSSMTSKMLLHKPPNSQVIDASGTCVRPGPICLAYLLLRRAQIAHT